jgi:hypothetical protein
VFACDRVFHMDDVRIQQVRADAVPDSNIAVMLDWMKAHPGPIYTSRPHPDYPGLVRFPLQDVLNDLGTAYFNGTAAYAAPWPSTRRRDHQLLRLRLHLRQRPPRRAGPRLPGVLDRQSPAPAASASRSPRSRA